MSIIYCCIECKKPLQFENEHFFCPACKKKYRVFAGIPNFKKGEIYPGEEKNLIDLASQYDRLSFEELLDYADSQNEKNVLPWEYRRSARFVNKSEKEKKDWLNNYSNEIIIKSGKEQMHVTRALLEYADEKPKGEKCLDIGCGRGPWAVIASTVFKHVYALDYDMASLIIAKKYCDSQNIKNITFLSSSSSALPFQDDSFDLINSQAVLEHVDIQFKSLQEIQRVLCQGGYFTGDSVNRYNIFTPEPHVGLRFIGFFPKPLAHKISLIVKKFPYNDIKPLSSIDLNDMLKRAFSKHKIIPFVELPNKSLTQSVMKAMPSWFMQSFTHTHYILAGK